MRSFRTQERLRLRTGHKRDSYNYWVRHLSLVARIENSRYLKEEFNRLQDNEVRNYFGLEMRQR